MQRSPHESWSYELRRGHATRVFFRKTVCSNPRRARSSERPFSVVLRLVLALAALVMAGIRARAQESTPIIRSETAGVVVDVIVTDRKGHHVRGLTADDFRVYENETPQTIASFTPPLSRVDGSAVSPPAPAPGGGYLPGPPIKAHAPQFITVLIDLGDIHQQNLKHVCTAASTFAQKAVASGDLVAVYWVDASLHLAAPFTREPQQLRDVFDKLSRHTPSGRLTGRDRERSENEIDDLFTQVYPETLLGGQPVSMASKIAAAGKRPPPEVELQLDTEQEKLREMNVLRSWLTVASSLQARIVLVALRALAISYRNIPGRKAVMVFSEGFLHSPSAGREMQGVVDAAQRANVAIYVIDATGLDTGMRPDINAMYMGLQKRYTQDFAIAGPGQQAMGLSPFDWMQTLGSDPDDDLGNLAVATGGFLERNANDLGQAIDRVLDDASEFYTLMYYPSNRSYDGAFRSIRVELRERRDHLRYRQGYWALPPGREVMVTPAGAQLLASIEAGNDKSAFTPELNAALAPSADGRYGIAVAVSMPGSVVRFEKIKDEYVADVNTLLVARDAVGQILGVQERYGHVRLTRAEHEEFSTTTFNLQGHVGIPDLKPVSVQAVIQFTDGTLGISDRTKIVPEPSALNLRLTSLVLADEERESECHADPLDPLCFDNLRIVLPAHPRFAITNQLLAYISVLGLQLDQQQKPALRLTFTLEHDNVTKPINPLRLQAGPGYGVGNFLALAVIDLKGVQPGAYRLRVTADDERQHAQVSESAMIDLR